MLTGADITRLERLLAKLPAILDEGADAGADVTVRIARANVPVGPDAPHTRDTIASVATEPGVREVEGKEAAIVIELGTRFMPARPFLLPAAMDAEVFRAFADAVKDALE